MLKTQSEEITNLKATIDDLINSIAKLTSKNQGSKIQIAPKNAMTSTASAHQTIATNVTPTKHKLDGLLMSPYQVLVTEDST